MNHRAMMGVMRASLLMISMVADRVVAKGAKAPASVRIENKSGASVRWRSNYANTGWGSGELGSGEVGWVDNMAGGSKLAQLTVQSVKFDQSCPNGCATRTWTSKDNPPSSEFVEGIFEVVVEPTQVHSSFVRKSDGTLKEFTDAW